MKLRKRSAFTLIELLVVITILAILAGAALPYVQNYVSESRISKAKSDLEEIKKALAIYETREGPYKADTLHQLTGRYLNNSPIDPWGKAYVVATSAGTVFSSGPDRINGNIDDIVVNYQPPLALVQIRWVDANQTGAVDTQNTQDYLQLFFSRRIATSSPIVAAPLTAAAYFSWTSAADISTSLEWAGLQLATSAQLITIPVTAGLTNVFGPGSDSVMVIDGSGIVDTATVANRCMTDQDVVIAAQ
jgi:general secretion pathway protein G